MALIKTKIVSHPGTNLYLKVAAKVSEAIANCNNLVEFYNYLNTDLKSMKTGNHAKTDNYYELERSTDSINIWKLDAKADRVKILWIVREQ